MSVETLTEQILQKISTINRWQYNFMLQLFSIWIALRGRYTFTHLARWGVYREDTYRKHFGRSFDWLAFNSALAEQQLERCNRVLAFDPCYLPKSGKHTPGIGYFYSGCAGREQKGLEISGIAVVNTADKSALHLEAFQTIDRQSNETLLCFYGRQIVERSEALQSISERLVADAYFARKPFVDKIVQAGFHFTTRLQKNSRLRYLYIGPRKSGRGRPRTYDGRIDVKAPREDHFCPCAQAEDGSWKAFHGMANVQAWKRNVRLVIVHHYDESGQIKSVRLYACTDLHSDGAEVLQEYHCRFQIEFLYRDAKQHTGLTHCQARSREKIHFHINTALTAVSIAKVVHHLQLPVDQRGPFSMADIKTLYANDLMLDRFISTFGIDPHLSKIIAIRDQIRKIGLIAA